MLFKILYGILETIINVSSCALILCSLFWLLYLISEIRRIYPLWKYQLRVRPDEAENKAKYYKNILIKHALSVLFVLSELITFSAETFEGAFHLIALQLGDHYTSTNGMCRLKINSYLWWNIEVPAVRILETIRQIGMFLLPTTLTIVVLHLQSIYTGFNRQPQISFHAQLAAACIFIFIIMKSFRFTIIISEMLYITLLPILFYLLTKQTRYLYLVLRQKLMDLWYEGCSYKAMYEREKRLISLFKLTVLPIYVSAVIGVFGQMFDGIVYAVIGSIFLNSCWISSEYNVSLNGTFGNGTIEGIESLVFVSKFVFLSTGSLFTCVVVVVNVGIFVSVFTEQFKCRYFGRASLKTLLVYNVN